MKNVIFTILLMSLKLFGEVYTSDVYICGKHYQSTMIISGNHSSFYSSEVTSDLNQLTTKESIDLYKSTEEIFLKLQIDRKKDIDEIVNLSNTYTQNDSIKIKKLKENVNDEK